MTGWRELMLLIRLSNANLSVWQYTRDLERARSGLDKSLAVRDAAQAELTIHDNMVRARREIPPSLLSAPGKVRKLGGKR